MHLEAKGAKDRWQPPGAGRGGQDPPLDPQRERSPAHTWVSDLGTQNREKQFLLCKHPQ